MILLARNVSLYTLDSALFSQKPLLVRTKLLSVPEDRTPRRTHIFLSLVSVPHLTALFTRTCVRVAHVKLVT